MKSIAIAMAALAMISPIGAGTLLADDDDNEELIAAINRQTEAIESAIQDQTFQQQLDALLLEDAIEDAAARQRDCWYLRNW